MELARIHTLNPDFIGLVGIVCFDKCLPEKKKCYIEVKAFYFMSFNSVKQDKTASTNI